MSVVSSLPTTEERFRLDMNREAWEALKDVLIGQQCAEERDIAHSVKQIEACKATAPEYEDFWQRQLVKHKERLPKVIALIDQVYKIRPDFVKQKADR